MVISACSDQKEALNAIAFQTSAAGHQISPVTLDDALEAQLTLKIDPDEVRQEIIGIGGAFTQSTAHLLMAMPADKRAEILNAYFSNEGAAYSFCRTHMNSCDFSTHTYSYTPVEGDTGLEHFSIARDFEDIIPIIKQAQSIADREIKFLASPWTAAPWMKDNGDWNGGSLLPVYRQTWADFFVKYYEAYAAEGISMWGFTVENEPLGNNSNWESMHYTPESMAEFIKGFLGPTLKQSGVKAKVLVYDQNRDDEMKHWADVLLRDETLLPFIDGTAVHWYSSTVDFYGPSLQYVHDAAPDKHLIHSEACIDAEVPVWRDDAWYWSKEATDWGFDWAKPENKKDHPKYVPTFRYARDIIGCLNNQVEGWIDWNMVLDKQGGPNHASNWCIAPVIVDTNTAEVYYTPLYYILAQFSRFIEPGAVVLNTAMESDGIMVLAVKNPDDQIVCYVLNMNEEDIDLSVALKDKQVRTKVLAKSLQTILIEQPKDNEE
jgi:glucosylceramidase